MLTAMWGLRSTNNNGIKTIYVKVRNDSNPVTITLDYIICAATEHETVTMAQNEEKEVPHVHQESGTCTVEVSEAQSKLKNDKLLDLDAAQSP